MSIPETPWTEEEGEIPCDWAQREFYGAPVIAGRIEELVGRISMFSVGGANVLRLWDPRDQLDVHDVLAGLQLPRDGYAVSRSPASRTPVETGYLECMHLTPIENGVAAAVAIAEFSRSQEQRYGEMERFLVECYGTLTPEQEADRRFKSIDYPHFDLGSMSLGFGLFAEHTPYRSWSIWCWSRVVNWHK